MRNEISDADVALMDAVKSLIEIMIAADVARPENFDAAFHHQGAHYERQGLGAAAAVMAELRRFVNDPARAKARETMAKLLEEPPAGSA